MDANKRITMIRETKCATQPRGYGTRWQSNIWQLPRRHILKGINRVYRVLDGDQIVRGHKNGRQGHRQITRPGQAISFCSICGHGSAVGDGEIVVPSSDGKW